MKVIREARTIGTAAPIQNATVTVQTWPGLVSVATGATGSDGRATLTAQGAPGPVRIRSERSGTIYDEYSNNVGPAGKVSLDMLKLRLSKSVNDGVIATFGNQFRLTVGAGSITLDTGGVILGGIIGIFRAATILSVTDGDRAAVAVLTGEAVSLAEIAYSAIVAGTHVPIYRYTVSGGNVVSSSVQSIHRYAGPRRGSRAIPLIVRCPSGTSSNASGEDSGCSGSTPLESGVTYDVIARAGITTQGIDGAIAIQINGNTSAYQSADGDITTRLRNEHAQSGISDASLDITLFDRRDTAISSAHWEQQAAYGPTFNSLALSGAGQVAVDSAGRVLIADTGNNRLVILTSAGAYSTGVTGINSIVGVCVDSSDNIYITYDGGSGNDIRIRKYNSSLVQQWDTNLSSTLHQGASHCCTDGTNLWVADKLDNKVYKRLCSTGAAVSNFGNGGSGDGQFGTNSPWGIAVDATYLYVTDQGNSRIQKFTKATGAFFSKWTASSSGRGLSLDGAGNLLMANHGGDTVTRYTIAGASVDTFAMADPDGVVAAPGATAWVVTESTGSVRKWAYLTGTLPFTWINGLIAAFALPRG
jgi:hypothetical protein